MTNSLVPQGVSCKSFTRRTPFLFKMAAVAATSFPERDSVRDLTRRMRQHADEVFTLRDIDLEFEAAEPDQNLRLEVKLRRDLLLIFKEAVNNAARHSECSRVKIDFRARGSELLLVIEDNG